MSQIQQYQLKNGIISHRVSYKKKKEMAEEKKNQETFAHLVEK
jgi:hypothetical protein